MQRYGPTSNFDRALRATRLARDEQGVSEVIGYILMFGILSIITVFAMLTFATAHAAAQDRVVELRADSAAERVAGIVVTAALFAEAHQNEGTFERRIDLAPQFEGREYTVSIVRGVGSDPDRIEVMVPGISYTAQAPLFSAGSPSGFALCTSPVPGGIVRVLFGAAPAGLLDCDEGVAGIWLEGPA
jgi:hypothetical protein